MANITILSPAKNNKKLNGIDDNLVASKIVKEVKALLAERKQKAPKRINYFGSYGSWICFCYGTKEVRNALNDVFVKHGYEVIVHKGLQSI